MPGPRRRPLRTSAPVAPAPPPFPFADTSAAGRIDTELMNQACWISSRIWNGRLGSALAV